MRNKNKLISALKPLKPVSVVDMITGEYLSKSEYEPVIENLLHYVTQATRSLYEENTEQLLSDLESFTGSANSFGRQKGYRIDYTALPAKVKAKSRVQELVLHKLISETASYVSNPTENKQEPTFTHKLNLGSVNDQMARVIREPDAPTLYLQWKCWDRELLLEFTIPTYLLSRDIIKWSLPSVQYNKKQELVFYFSTQEQIPERTGNLLAGMDAGVKELYTAVVINSRGVRVADYRASNRLKQLQRRKERLVTEKAFIIEKIKTLEKYKSDTTVLVTHRDYLGAKIGRLGKDIAAQAGNELITKLDKHAVTILNIEELNWVSGTSKSKIGSNHSFQHACLQDSITHAGLRVGIRSKKVSPRNTSQDCYSCGSKVTHRAKSRSVYCGSCKITMDRDYNAAMNLARKSLSNRPLVNGYKGRSTSESNPALNGNENSSLHSLAQNSSLVRTRT